MDIEKPIDINNKDVERALSGVLSTKPFEKAFRLRQLLTHLVSKQLAGESDDLKGYNIGLDVFDKGTDFDPDTDTIVRVQMVRLRRMLEHYYLTDGQHDNIIIEVPKGRYLPVFRASEKGEEAPDGKQIVNETLTLFRSLKLFVLVRPWLIAIVMGSVALLSYMVSSHLFNSAGTAQKTVMKRLNYRIPSGPSVAVFPFNNETAKQGHSGLVRGIPAHIIHTLTRFKDLFILAPDTTLAKHNAQVGELEQARRLEVDYVLNGGFGVAGNELSVSIFLTRVSTGQIIWSKDFGKSLTGYNLHEIQASIAAAVARELGQPYGVINRVETALRKRNKQLTYSAYDCLLQFFDYAQDETEPKHLKVRTCLEQSTKKNSGHAQSWAALSWLYVEEHRNGYNVTPDLRKTAIDRAYVAARKAIVLDPGDAFNHRRMASVLISRDGVYAAQASIMRAAELNPNNADVLADVGWIIKNTGRWEEAFLYARKAIRLNPGHPPWYLETPILYHYRIQDCHSAYRKAKNYNLQVSGTALSQVLVIVSGMLCREADLSSHVAVLNTKYPSFLTNPRKLLLDHAVPKELFPEIIAHLQEAGVAVDG